nr:reverse transcriptase domain-containing protein [Tanacetum cinerariifolium]
SRTDPTLLNNFEMAAEGNGDLLVPDLRTMEELCQPSLNGRGGPIAPIAIQETNFGLKNDMIQQLRNKITNFRQRPDESLFEAWERYNQIDVIDMACEDRGSSSRAKKASTSSRRKSLFSNGVRVGEVVETIGS